MMPLDLSKMPCARSSTTSTQSSRKSASRLVSWAISEMRKDHKMSMSGTQCNIRLLVETKFLFNTRGTGAGGLDRASLRNIISKRCFYTRPPFCCILRRSRTAWRGVVSSFSPNQGVLIGLDPVKIARSYRMPPNRHPQNGATMGIQK